MSISVENLYFAYGSRSVLTGITAKAAPGRLTAVLGRNAVGKSTLLRCITGALKPASGLVRIDGMPAHRIPPRNLAVRLAYVAQRPVVSAAFTVRQVIELGRYALPPAPGKVDEVLSQLALEGLSERSFPELSVGQQQRVMLARAVAQLSPDGCLILDEPMSAMDLRHVRDVLRLLRELAWSGATILIVLHDVGLAASVADDVWLLQNGGLAAAGAMADVLTLPQLQAVFDISFQWLTDPNGCRHLVAADSG